jgi:lysophospholipase L1-like esterase
MTRFLPLRGRSVILAVAAAALLLGSVQACQAQPSAPGTPGAAAPSPAAPIAVQSGQKIAFLGDSITDQGGRSQTGYVNLVMAGLEANGVTATAVPAGVGGNQSKDMLSRLDRDVIGKTPDWVTVSCGVNDVWHPGPGDSLDKYKENMIAIVDKAQKAGIKVMILTATMIGEDAGNENNKTLVAYNDFLRTLAKEKNCLLADLNLRMQETVKVAGGGQSGGANTLTSDGVHMNPLGNLTMAIGVLKAFGLSEAQLAKARASWTDKTCDAGGNRPNITLRQYEQLVALAARQKRPVSALINEAYAKAMADLVKTSETNR